MIRLYWWISVVLFFVMTQGVHAENTLRFARALDWAFQNNPELQAQIQKANDIKGRFVQNSQFLNPSIRLEGENIGGSGSFKGFESAETTLSVTQPIPLGGKWHTLRQASYAQYQAMIISIQRKKAELYIAVGEAYIDVLYADKWHRVTKKLTRLNENIVEDITRRKNAGASAELDLKLAQIALGEARIQQSRACRAIKKKKAFLERLIGKGHADGKILEDKGLPHYGMSWTEITDSIGNNVFVAEKKAQLSAKRAVITAVKKDVWPTLQFQLGGRHFADDNENALVIATSSSLPVFDRNQGKILSSEAQYTQTLQELRALQLELRQKLTASFLDMRQNLEESQRVKKELLPLAKKAAALAQKGYQQGLYTYIDLSNAMRVLFEEERHYQSSHARLDKAMIRITGYLRKE
ncbi:TolC family protein [Legionella spiritensis]|uniref:TolC family protein n=1 Tax=Legionella spiritensis TaxID=452 RepID=UPI000F7184E5|nr:TolC family protein [Legionella spiritensis]VEG90270.1 cobalt/zinc/cadmium efflux RND transporter, outer membrane protein [Legionella spiritensis]